MQDALKGGDMNLAKQKYSDFPVIYELSATLESTACLIGLINAKERIDCVLFRTLAGRDERFISYIDGLNRILLTNNYPPIFLSSKTDEHIHRDVYWNWYRALQKLAEWGWKVAECRTLLEMSKVRLP